MSEERVKVIIEGRLYTGILEESTVTVIDEISEEEADVLGHFELNPNNELIQHYPMSNTKAIIGKHYDSFRLDSIMSRQTLSKDK